MYLERDDYATGFYVDTFNRATTHPTAERLLEAFQGLTLTIIREDRRWRSQFTPLSRLHQRILALLDFSEAIYMGHRADSRKPPENGRTMSSQRRYIRISLTTVRCSRRFLQPASNSKYVRADTHLPCGRRLFTQVIASDLPRNTSNKMVGSMRRSSTGIRSRLQAMAS